MPKKKTTNTKADMVRELGKMTKAELTALLAQTLADTEPESEPPKRKKQRKQRRKKPSTEPRQPQQEQQRGPVKQEGNVQRRGKVSSPRKSGRGRQRNQRGPQGDNSSGMTQQARTEGVVCGNREPNGFLELRDRKHGGRLVCEGDRQVFYDDNGKTRKGKDGKPMLIDEVLVGNNRPAERRPPQELVEMDCGVCGDTWMIRPNEMYQADGRWVFTCDDCKRKRD